MTWGFFMGGGVWKKLMKTHDERGGIDEKMTWVFKPLAFFNNCFFTAIQKMEQWLFLVYYHIYTTIKTAKEKKFSTITHAIKFIFIAHVLNINKFSFYININISTVSFWFRKQQNSVVRSIHLFCWYFLFVL